MITKDQIIKALYNSAKKTETEHGIEMNFIFSNGADAILNLLQGDISGSLLKDWQMWEDCILSFLRSHRGIRAKFNEHVDEWNAHTKLPPSAYERGEQ